MIDLHTHTFASDGELSYAEHIRRAIVKGYKAIAITDHADSGNIKDLTKNILDFCKTVNKYNSDFYVLSGIELTHIYPEEIKDLTEFARSQGIDIVAVHGETINEPVMKNTNLFAVKAKVDFLAHPGLIEEEVAEIASKNNVYLEITSRKGHSLTNAYVYKIGKKYNCKFIINTDSHISDDFITEDFAKKILLGAGIEPDEIKNIFMNSIEIVNKIKKR